MMQLVRAAPCALLLAVLGLLSGPTAGHAQEATSPYNFPYGYPFSDYPVAGAAHPSQSYDYLADPPNPTQGLKRVAPHALRLIQTDRAETAIDYANRYMETHPNLMDAELLFMRSMAQAQLGRTDAAARSMRAAIEETDLPPERFLAGPRRLFAPLHNHEAFVRLWEKHRDELVHGPMLGRMTDTSVAVWVRTVTEMPVRVAVRESPGQEEPVVVSDPVMTQSDADYTAEVPVRGLQPDTEYSYEVLLGSERIAVGGENQQFRTYPRQHQSDQFRIAFGGCGGYVPHNERMWDTIAQFNPRAFFTLGDNVYIDDPESPDQARYRYYRRQSRPEFQRLVSGSPVYSIWDDHDFGMNDSWGGPREEVPYWKPMVGEIFSQNWVNPTYGSGDKPGVWFDTHVGDVHFIFLDGRYYREDTGRMGGEGVENPSMLGPDQMDWLEETLTESEATFKVLVSPVPWHYDAKGDGPNRVDGWAGYKNERETIFSWIDEHEIEGVLLMSSDRHRSDAWVTEREGGYDLYEVSSGQFTNQHTHSVLEGALFGYNEKPSFGLLHFDTEADDPTVTYEVVNINGVKQDTLRIQHSDLTY
ncbi:MAG: alkaline phosphatase D family protein [Salinivenus sp.]